MGGVLSKQLVALVVAPDDTGLTVEGLLSHTQRVLMVRPSAYAGRVVVQAPLFTEYCMELPPGQPIIGAEMLAPTGWQLGPQMPLLITTLPGVLARLGQQSVPCTALFWLLPIDWPLAVAAMGTPLASTPPVNMPLAFTLTDVKLPPPSMASKQPSPSESVSNRFVKLSPSVSGQLPTPPPPMLAINIAGDPVVPICDMSILETSKGAAVKSST